MGENTYNKLDKVIEIIQAIGYAEYNNINQFKINDSNDKPIMTFISEKGNGYNYHIYDYNLVINCPNDRRIIIKIERIDKDLNNPYMTRIFMIFEENSKKYVLKTDINGWGADVLKRENIVNIESLSQNEEELNILPIGKWDYEVSLDKNGNKESFANLIRNQVDLEKEQKLEREQKIDNLLNSLSEEEKKVLKRKLGTRN